MRFLVMGDEHQILIEGVAESGREEVGLAKSLEGVFVEDVLEVFELRKSATCTSNINIPTESVYWICAYRQGKLQHIKIGYSCLAAFQRRRSRKHTRCKNSSERSSRSELGELHD